MVNESVKKSVKILNFVINYSVFVLVIFQQNSKTLTRLLVFSCLLDTIRKWRSYFCLLEIMMGF